MQSNKPIISKQYIVHLEGYESNRTVVCSILSVMYLLNSMYHQFCFKLIFLRIPPFSIPKIS